MQKKKGKILCFKDCNGFRTALEEGYFNALVYGGIVFGILYAKDISKAPYSHSIPNIYDCTSCGRHCQFSVKNYSIIS
jgi:hypothetical protein